MAIAWSKLGNRTNLTFHGVGEPSRRLDQREESVWLSVDQFESVLDWVGDRRDVRISFDDGNSSDVQVALPALTRRGLRATFFVVAGRVGSSGYLDAGEIETLVAADMTVGSHGMSHRSWRRLDERELRNELVESRRQLEQIVGSPITQAACPFGAYDRRALGALRRHGYQQVFTSDGGLAHSESWLQARTTMCTRDRADALDELFSMNRSFRAELPARAKRLVKRWR